MPEPPPPADEYPLSPDEPPPIERRLPLPQVDPPADAERDQFSLAELFGLVAVTAVVFSAVSSAMRWMGIKSSPGNLAAAYAMVFGFGALITMVLLAIVPPMRRIVTVGWWLLLGLYIVTAAAAVLMVK